MASSRKYPVLILSFLLLGITAATTKAQQADSTDSPRRTFFFKSEQDRYRFNLHSERSFQSYSFPESGIYAVPEQTQYYVPEFKGQYYLDLAVEAYREEQRDKLGLNWLFQFMNYISPFVNNRFEFGVYQIYDMPIVGRENPLFQSYKNDEERN